MSYNPAISADGRSVAFESYATNLVPVDSNGVRDVFVWNADTNRVSAVSENRGTEANNEAFEPTISADGNLIAFSSSAGNLTPGVEGTSTVNVYLRDMRSGEVTLISKNEKTGKAGGGSNPSISEDGSRIAFYNYFPLTKEDQNTLWDIYVWESGNPKLKRVSKTASGGDKDQGEESSSRVVSPSISGNGKYVAFATTATNMVSNDTNKLQDVFVVEVDSGRITRVSEKAGEVQGDGDSPIGQGEKIAISFDGSLIAFSTKATNLGGNILVRRLTGNEFTAISGDTVSSVTQPVMSRNGNYIVFGTNQKLDGRFQSTGIFAVSTGLKIN
jgi:Tol biopolymer transport system component